uniref:Uncharacterized protein n=1 Tax=Anguilla anguilla TaxID=7936 RepID=A0A0E9UWY6_ANGAN
MRRAQVIIPRLWQAITKSRLLRITYKFLISSYYENKSVCGCRFLKMAVGIKH